jgi:hypothetical protein
MTISISSYDFDMLLADLSFLIRVWYSHGFIASLVTQETKDIFFSLSRISYDHKKENKHYVL